MAADTKKTLRQSVIYSLYVRSHTKEGTFRAVISDLDRIKDLGTDIIWFMPIHPVGEAKKKGSVGSPYAIRNYREVNPEYGTMDDFVRLTEEIHRRGMKCMIDVVYNHTSPDAVLLKEHPEFYYWNEAGEYGNKVADWGDVIDLNFQNRALWDYHIESLKMWAEIVDGFRCDVAPLIPLEFWLKAREEVSEIRPDCIWLAETVEHEFIKLNRSKGLTALSDGEVYQAFDITYDYDVINYWRDYMEGKGSLERYISMLNLQDVCYPDNYVKLRFLENHDRPRVTSYVKKQSDLLNWTAFLYFQKGATLLYGGQEMQESRKPSLFEIEKIEWDHQKDISDYLKKLVRIKSQTIVVDGDYEMEKDQRSDTIIGYYRKADTAMIGVFPVRSEKCELELRGIADGMYQNLIDGKEIEVVDSRVKTQGNALIFTAMK